MARPLPFIRGINSHSMVLGCEERYPPGKAVSSDKLCPASADGFCSFYDADAADSDAIPEGKYMCPGCNDEMAWNDFEHVSLDAVYASRDKKDPDWR